MKLKIADIFKTEIEIKGGKLPFDSLFKINGMLGVGSFGIVLEVINLKSNEVNALKVMLKEDSKQVFKMNDNTMEEEVLQSLKHENIINFKQVLFSIDHVFMEMEKCNGGTLEDFLN
jgi:serine/threonine protein kinase